MWGSIFKLPFFDWLNPTFVTKLPNSVNAIKLDLVARQEE